MIRVSYETGNHCMTMDGHAGAGEYGHDIVCAAASILMHTLEATVMDNQTVYTSLSMWVPWSPLSSASPWSRCMTSPPCLCSVPGSHSPWVQTCPASARSSPAVWSVRRWSLQLGKQAMKDSMGQTAALTGGYGNSYGSAVGQQQYDAYLQRLNDVLPELYGQAYNQYNAEGDRLKEQYSLAANLRDTEYNQYRDKLGDYQYNQTWDAQQKQQKADDLAKYGDFTGYEELYGKEVADRMRNTWAAANPMGAYMNGTITGDQYYTLTGEYPPGYTPAGAAAGGGGSTRAASDILRDQVWERANREIANGGNAQEVIKAAQEVAGKYRF